MTTPEPTPIYDRLIAESPLLEPVEAGYEALCKLATAAT